jgi:DNA-binding transcriptional MerR regulator
MSGERYTIGQLARRTALPVKTVRYYSDLGLVPPAERSPGGYRLYDLEAVARLDLIRTLRELGFGLATVRRVLERPAGLAEIAAVHADALDAQIRTLTLRRAVLRAVARRGKSIEGVRLMGQLAKMSDAERRKILQDFLDEVLSGLDIDPDFERMMRSAMPNLPEDPTPEQVAAWVELAELVRDPDFRRRVRAMAEHGAKERAAGRGSMSRETGSGMADLARAALAAGIAPGSDAARPVLNQIVAAMAAGEQTSDSPTFRSRLLANLRVGTDARSERYWQLLATINGWPTWPETTPAFEWIIAALAAHPAS